MAYDKSELDSNLAALGAVAVEFEPEQGLFAVLAPLFDVILKSRAIRDALKNVPGLHGHGFQ